MISPELSSAIAQTLRDPLGSEVTIVNCRSIGGGCISKAFIVRLSNGAEAFVKSNALSFQEAFEIESRSLRDIARVGELPVPEPLGVGTTSQESFFVCEAVTESRRPSDFFERFGRALARHHRQSIRKDHQQRYGWQSNNFLGSATQVNQWSADWISFFAEHRFEYQIAWAKDQSLSSMSLSRLIADVLKQLPNLIGDSCQEAVLLHGDLWSGNYISNAVGDPVVIDPAVYYGSREAEFGMIKLFGNCPTSFYHAYNETWAMADGWERRAEVYKLYHLLNHLNLFGGGYQAECIACAESVLSN